MNKPVAVGEQAQVGVRSHGGWACRRPHPTRHTRMWKAVGNARRCATDACDYTCMLSQPLYSSVRKHTAQAGVGVERGGQEPGVPHAARRLPCAAHARHTRHSSHHAARCKLRPGGWRRRMSQARTAESQNKHNIACQSGRPPRSLAGGPGGHQSRGPRDLRVTRTRGPRPRGPRAFTSGWS